jgi:hypothetical protein
LYCELRSRQLSCSETFVRILNITISFAVKFSVGGRVPAESANPDKSRIHGHARVVAGQRPAWRDRADGIHTNCQQQRLPPSCWRSARQPCLISAQISCAVMYAIWPGRVTLVDLGLRSACDTKERNWQNTHPSAVNVMSIMLATHGVPHSTPSHVEGTLTAHCYIEVMYAYGQAGLIGDSLRLYHCRGSMNPYSELSASKSL